jgi:4a-hydroxytetrahydrobiopterin dehydratase
VAILSDDELRVRLGQLPGWMISGERLRKTFRFASFPAAIAFMVRASFDAERNDHHPDWTNVYDRVEVALWSHDAGGITERDFALAAALDRAAG